MLLSRLSCKNKKLPDLNEGQAAFSPSNHDANLLGRPIADNAGVDYRYGALGLPQLRLWSSQRR